MPILQSTGPMCVSRPPRLPTFVAQFIVVDSLNQQIGATLGLWSFIVNPASIVSTAVILILPPSQFVTLWHNVFWGLPIEPVVFPELHFVPLPNFMVVHALNSAASMPIIANCKPVQGLELELGYRFIM